MIVIQTSAMFNRLDKITSYNRARVASTQPQHGLISLHTVWCN